MFLVVRIFVVTLHLVYVATGDLRKTRDGFRSELLFKFGENDVSARSVARAGVRPFFIGICSVADVIEFVYVIFKRNFPRGKSFVGVFNVKIIV